MLLEKNAKLVNFQDREGSTAMHLAASCGYLECVKTLLASGADITLRNAIGQTPLEEAQDSELRESSSCVEHLRGIWRQLEEEAAARMMAMLEMEEEADKNATGTNATGIASKKNKKKNKKAKRKAAKQQQQDAEQDADSKATEQDESDIKGSDPEPVIEEPSDEPDCDTTTETVGITQPQVDEANAESSEEEEQIRESIVSAGQNSGDEVDDHTAEPDTAQATAQQDYTTPSTGAWTTYVVRRVIN
ncbi:hypothetical protein PHMEG_00034693 [Phytophthora megakarya]|uniref:Uncharacterized protein n=1 Tax=Phytophthora megakarya TaxID=4795 RepID=A0A225UQG6_9STRA|nr:hypothetical protein PHMEG_00034693 [Phytophthora megakarya]